MPKHSGINRPYMAGEIEKTPQEKQRELDEKMKKFLAKGGKVTKVKAHKPTKQQMRDCTRERKKKDLLFVPLAVVGCILCLGALLGIEMAVFYALGVL